MTVLKYFIGSNEVKESDFYKSIRQTLEDVAFKKGLEIGFTEDEIILMNYAEEEARDMMKEVEYSLDKYNVAIIDGKEYYIKRVISND